MLAGSLRVRLALLYGGVFLVLALVVLSIPFLAVRDVSHVGSSTPPAVSYPEPAAADRGPGRRVQQARPHPERPVRAARGLV